MTPEDEETTPEEPWVLETTFGVIGGVVTPSAWTSRLRFGRKAVSFHPFPVFGHS